MTRYERWEQRSEIPLLTLGLAFLVAYATPIIDPDIPLGARIGFEVVEIVTWAAFALDFVVRLALAPDRRHFVKTHLLDLAAVLLPVLRPLRALRVLSIVFLSARRLSKVLRNRVMTYVVITALAVWFIAGLAVTDAERLAEGSNIHTVWQGWWWSFITMATVGYGDVYPVTLEGRFVAVGLVVTGIALVGTVTAYIASWFASATREAEIAIKAELDTAEDKIDLLATEIRELRALLENGAASPLPTPKRASARKASPAP
jgi:voltage-gated potassium channel